MDLPEEVMLIIFAKLSQLTILASVVPVCTSWKSIVDSDVSFWNELKIFIDCDSFLKRTYFSDAVSESDNKYSWLPVGEGDLKSVHKVKQVKFYNFNRGSNRPDRLLVRILERVGRVCDRVDRVELDHCLGTNSKHFLKRLGQRYEAIHELKFGLNSVYLYPYDQLVNFKNLRTFESEDYLFSGKDLNTLADNCVHLEKFWIVNTLGVKDEHFASFLDKRKDTIRGIGIGFRVTDASLCKIKECKNVDTLFIGDARGLSDAVFQWTDELDKLRYLAIRRSNASADAVLNWLQSSKVVSNLLVLNLTGFYYDYARLPQWASQIEQICAKTRHSVHEFFSERSVMNLTLIKEDFQASQAHSMFQKIYDCTIRVKANSH